MRNKKKLMVLQLDEKMKSFRGTEKVMNPPQGWIAVIRMSLNMTMEQLGKKLGITKGAVQKLEEREAAGRISLNKLKAVGDALNLHFVYGFVPIDGTLENLVDRKAKEMARKIVFRTHYTMQLENQGIAEDKINQSIIELADELKRNMKRSLWD